MQIILEQLGLLFLFMACGYAFGRKGLVKPEHSRVLSTLGVYLFSPCVVLRSFSIHFSVANIRQYYPLIMTAAVLVVVLIVLARFGAKLLCPDGGYERNVYEYSLVTPNYGFMGYALAEGIYGPEALLNMILFAIPHYIYTYSMGYCHLTNQPLSPKRLFNPVMTCLLIGAFLGVTGIELPGVINTFLEKGVACMAPTGMLLTGIVISEFDIKQLVTDKKVYITAFLRLIAIPLAALMILKPICSENIVRSAILLLAMPCGLNTIILPKLAGEDCRTGAKLAFVSNLLSMLTIPFILNLI